MEKACPSGKRRRARDFDTLRRNGKNSCVKSEGKSIVPFQGAEKPLPHENDILFAKAWQCCCICVICMAMQGGSRWICLRQILAEPTVVFSGFPVICIHTGNCACVQITVDNTIRVVMIVFMVFVFSYPSKVSCRDKVD